MCSAIWHDAAVRRRRASALRTVVRPARRSAAKEASNRITVARGVVERRVRAAGVGRKATTALARGLMGYCKEREKGELGKRDGEAVHGARS